MNKKGFTLIELLTVIIVLAAISLVVIPAVNNSLNKSNEQAYDAQISSIENAAKSWLADHIDQIPDNGEQVVITLGELQDGNYISKNLENPKTKAPFSRNMQIIIKNVNENYVYSVIEGGASSVILPEEDDNSDDIIGFPLVDYLLSNKVNNNVSSGTSGLVAIGNSGEITTELSPREYRYIGPNPDNYVKFNNELWRIIGIFDGKLKIIRNESIGKIEWDINNNNDWTTSSLQQLLNSGDYYNRTDSYSSIGLTENAKNMIISMTWSIGAGPSYYGLEGSAQKFYECERGNVVYNNNAVEWSGKVGLIYISDYAFATNGGTSNSRNYCLEQLVGDWNESLYNECYKNNWLYCTNCDQWTLTSYEIEHHVFSQMYGGIIGASSKTTFKKAVKPTVYLKSNITYTSGNGSSSNPYVLK